MTTREKLDALAANMWWSWNPEVLDLFRRLNPEAFRQSRNNPLPALRQADASTLEEPGFISDVDEAYEALQQYLQRASVFDDPPQVAYFCMEYGLHESMPTYSGGLGILAGDHAKTASDLGVPFTAVGLLLREGYFRQHFDAHGTQLADHTMLDPEQHPLKLVTGDHDGAPLTVTVHLGHQPLHLQAWQLDLGRTTLYLLDTDFDANPEHLRGLTRRLYQGGNVVRIQQEIILGIGGLRMLRAIGAEADVYHMNEGHCAFLTLELMRELKDEGLTREEAEDRIRAETIFTTHTPVIAGHDRFAPHLFNEQMGAFREQLGLSEHELLAYGRVNPGDGAEHFTMTVLGLKLARQANGVSALNGHVARQQWHQLYLDRELDEVPIGHITNGIHLPTWTAPHARAFLNERFGDWLTRRTDPAFWAQVDELSDEELWRYRSTLRRILIEYAREHAAQQSLPQTPQLDPEALTIGFARRFATYKRAPLLFHDPDRAIRLLSQADRPVQVLYAGKAHPADEPGKALIRRIFEMSQHEAIQGRVVFLENYDMEVGRMLISGCDVWLNNPRRPMEASGTSGQKISVHGGLNVSILDGWWPEGYNGENGWPIGDEVDEPLEQHVLDARDAEALYSVLENEVVPTFFDRGDDGIPHKWVAHMRAAIRTLPHQFSSARMVTDYVEQMYRQPEGNPVPPGRQVVAD